MASILYTPEIDRGEQRQADEITKYDVKFKKGKTMEVDDHLSLKFLNCPYFSLAKKGAELAPKAAPKKRKILKANGSD